MSAEKAAVLIILLAGTFTVALSGGGTLTGTVTKNSTGLLMTFTQPKNTDLVFVLHIKNDTHIQNVTLDGASLISYISPITLIDGDISGVEYGQGAGMYDLNQEEFYAMRDTIGAGEQVYVLQGITSQTKKKRTLKVTYAQSGGDIDIYLIDRQPNGTIGALNAVESVATETPAACPCPEE